MAYVIKNQIISLTDQELEAANTKFGLNHSDHESFAILREEIDEAHEALEQLEQCSLNIWNATKENLSQQDMIDLYEKAYSTAIELAIEAVQVAAMAKKAVVSKSLLEMQKKELESILSGYEPDGQTLSLGGGTVRTARITSKGVSFAGRRHYNSEYIQSFCGREVMIHEAGGVMKAYLYDESSKLLTHIICTCKIPQHDLVDGYSASEHSGRYSNF